MQTAYGTHVGQVRKVNEDSLWCDTHLWIVADGMGGAAAGDVASTIAVEALKCWYPPVDVPVEKLSQEARRAVQGANRKVYDEAQKNSSLHGMGTTLTMGLYRDGNVIVAHVGDSRAYLWRDQVLTQITDDHSVVGELLRTGGLSKSQAEQHPHRNLLTRALGVAPHVEVDLQVVQIYPGDFIFLCSDGLTAVVSDAEIADMIGKGRTLDETVQALINCANRRGGPDNISVILAYYPGGPGNE